MVSRHPPRDLFILELLPAPSRFLSRMLCGLLIASLVVAQVLPAGLWLPGSLSAAVRKNADTDTALTAAGGVERSTFAIFPGAERACEGEDCAKRAKTSDLAADRLSGAGRTNWARRGKESGWAAYPRRAGTLVNLHVRLQI